ncbi:MULTISPECIES: U32 family peptidase [unclassified Clostridium]|uniref:U32 family peptidase n=1 Tax=unclassified Clostridium TaxID=2614128 RepID=UPI0002974F25|nr:MULTISPECIES: U32 family peptidase [unclassified Clostridium]EKQ55508.1 MAG: collagenase-like protease [Clostridium sp. Maddingley MBC34-26]
MKIVAGLGCIDDYIALVKAGADEVFCGYVPYEWNKKYGSLFPLNRREVLYYNIQIGSFEDMKILKKMVEVYKVPVSITFNYLYYLEEQYEIIAKIIIDLINIGFNDFIIADIALILYLKEKNIKCSIHLSGECAELNRLSIDFFNKLDISRYIFHRKNTIRDIESCINNNKVKNLEYEAFILNEKCHYTGAFCSSLHCDEMIHLCKMPYSLSKVSEDTNSFEEVDRRLEFYYKDTDIIEEFCMENQYDIENSEEGAYVLGRTGCGLCSLKELKKAGVTHLKVVGRGNSIENMEKDVQNLKKAICMLDDFGDSETYEKEVKNKLFNGRCSGQCYYLKKNKNY